jgi:hypothetical protein
LALQRKLSKANQTSTNSTATNNGTNGTAVSNESNETEKKSNNNSSSSLHNANQANNTSNEEQQTLKNVTNQLNTKEPPQLLSQLSNEGTIFNTGLNNGENVNEHIECENSENDFNNVVDRQLNSNDVVMMDTTGELPESINTTSQKNRAISLTEPEFNSNDSINLINNESESVKTHRKQHSMSEESFHQQLTRNTPYSSSSHRRAIKKTRVFILKFIF